MAISYSRSNNHKQVSIPKCFEFCRMVCVIFSNYYVKSKNKFNNYADKYSFCLLTTKKLTLLLLYYFLQAFTLFKEASELGNDCAMFNLGLSYENGVGTNKSYQKVI